MKRYLALFQQIHFTGFPCDIYMSCEMLDQKTLDVLSDMYL